MSIDIITPEQYITVIRSSGWRVILASAPWCQACKSVKPKLPSLNAPTYVIDVEAVEEFADAEHVTKLPTIFVYKDGHPKLKHEGADLTAVASLVNGP